VEQTGQAARAPERMVAAYRLDTDALLATRVGPALGLFVLLIGTACTLEWIYFPARRAALLPTCSLELLICLATIVLVQLKPPATWWATVLSTNALGLCISAYFARTHGNAEICVLGHCLLLTGLVVMYPWGLRGQAAASAGVLIGYPLALAMGAAPALPIPYGLFAAATAVALTSLGAHLLDRHRFAAFSHAAAIERAGAMQRDEQEFSTALLQVARALNATLSNPQALTEELTDHTRRAVGADWTFLYRRDPDEPAFRIAALSNAPGIVTAEMEALGFYPEGAPEFFAALQRTGTADLVRGAEQEPGPALMLERWQVTLALVQAIVRDSQVIGMLGCCYSGATSTPSAVQRRLLAAIAHQAAIALENASLMEEARAASNVKSEFVATVSHELRTPLNVIIGYADLLRDGTFGDPSPAQREPLERIRQQSAQLLELIQGMLDLNRLEARGLALTLEPCTLAEVFNSLRVSIPNSWCKEGVALEWGVADPQAVLHSDRGKVEMILRNLIHNALKYTDVGAVSVHTEARPQEGRIRFAVSDTGPGIAPEDLSTIFEIFGQGNSGPPRGGGVGLGLHIVKRLTEALGGQIAVDSRVGSGTRFTLSLPAQPPQHVRQATI